MTPSPLEPATPSAKMRRNGPYVLSDVPMGMPRLVRVVTVGAGASGINFARTLRNTLTGPFEHVVYEKNSQVGGTWYENRYPNCRCDIPSHNYQFSWKKNPAWSNFFAPAAEISQYLCDACEEEGLKPLIKTQHKVVSAVWNNDKSVWALTVENSEGRFLDEANFLVDASGILNAWKWPDVSGLHDFGGDLLHTASWPQDYDCTGKRVALIGNGASGVQLLPAIANKVQHLYHIIRSPTWIIPPRVATMKIGPAAALINSLDMDEGENFSAAQIEKFKSDPEFLRQFASVLESDSMLKFALSLVREGPQQAWAAQRCREYMVAVLKHDERLCKALIPDFAIGCRRLTPAPGYLEAMTTPQVTLVTNAIQEVVPQGIKLATGKIVEVDAIICATGFDSSFCPSFPVVGLRGSLQELWSKEVPKSYLSLGIAGLPNFFKFLGPNAPIAHGDVFTLSEHIATYVAKVIHKCQTQGITAIMPLDEAVDDYFEHVSALMPRTAWAGGCRSWYKPAGADGPVVGLHPGTRNHFIQMLSVFRGEDWEYRYSNGRQNRFGYLGNGFTMEELEQMKVQAASMA